MTWLGCRPEKYALLEVLESMQLDKASGIAGDHYNGRSGKRQVTLIQSEHITAIAGITGAGKIDPAILRRNIVVEGINILAFKGHCFQIGDAMLEYTGLCHPCSRMEKALGSGGYNAMRGHGGITARIIQSGKINLGDRVSVIK